MRISIIIPCHNVEKYITDCLNSVRLQTYKNLELICIDDGSKDQTLKTLKDFQRNFVIPIELIEQKNKGASAARNAGLEIATGDYIQFLDADDLLDKDKIAHQVKLIKEFAADISFLVGACKKISSNGNLINEFIPDSASNKWINLMKTKLGNTVSNLYNAKTLKRIGGWDESLQSSQEANLMFRLLKENDRILYDTKPLTVIRARESGSISQKDPTGNWQRYAKLREQIFLHVTKNNLAPKSDVQAALFDTIHILYPFDKKLALELYRNHLSGEYIPIETEVVSKGFAALVKAVGFVQAELIKSKMRFSIK